MAKETIQAVLNAEEKATLIEKEAISNGEAIVKKAKEDAKALIASMTKTSLDKAQKELEMAHMKSDQNMESSISKAEQEINLLKEVVKTKEQSAISLVLSEILQ